MKKTCKKELYEEFSRNLRAETSVGFHQGITFWQAALDALKRSVR